MTITNIVTPTTINGDLRRGGVRAILTVSGDTDHLKKGDNVLLEGLSGATYLDTDYRETFNGHCISDPTPINWDRYTSQVQVIAATANDLLSGESIQDIGFFELAAPANPHQIAPPMTLAKIFQHCIERHSNVIIQPDTAGIVDTDSYYDQSIRLKGYDVNKSNNMWQTLQSIGGGSENSDFCFAWFDRNNDLYYQPAPMFWDVLPSIKGDVNKSNIQGTVRATIRNSAPGQAIGQVRVTAVDSLKGFPFTVSFYNAVYPASPAEGQIIIKDNHLWAGSQGETNFIAERSYRWLTRPYTLQVQVDPGLLFFGDDGQGIDLGDALSVTYDGVAENTESGAGVHLQFSAARFWLFGYTVSFASTPPTCSLLLESHN